jgi:hypothetical protein
MKVSVSAVRNMCTCVRSDSVAHLSEGLAHDGGRAGVVVYHVAHNEDQRGLQVVDLEEHVAIRD